MRIRFTLAVILAASATFATASDSTTTSALPRYKLEPGLQLEYKGHGISDYKTTVMINSGTTSLTVLGKLPDGSAELMYYSESQYESKPKQDMGSGYKAQPRVSVGRAILKADGTRTDEGSLDFSTQSVLPQLPSTSEEIAKGWKSGMGRDGGYDSYKLFPGQTSDLLKIESKREGLHNEVYESTSETTFTFDLSKGYPTASHSINSQNYGFVGGGSYDTTLTQSRQLPLEEFRGFAADARSYIDTMETCAAKLKTIADSSDHTTQTLDEVRDMITALAGSLKVDDFKREAQRSLKRQEENRKYYLSRKVESNELIGKPSPKWEAVEIDGTTYTLESFRGKVVVMDFWYRGCGWCISAMPQIKEIAEHYRGKPVAVLGMNTDEDEKDARFVMSKLQLNYPTLRSPGINLGYKVQAFPTLVILDAKGTVRHFHVGYSPKLREEVITHVDELLKEQAGGG